MKEYDPKEIEEKWQNKWEEQKLFVALDDSKKQKFYALMEFPYPSGDGLHTGHVRGYTAMDVIARKRRMEGFEVMYPIGWDAFGLPTENYAIKTGLQPSLITKQNSDNFRTQFKKLGMSLDWSREINTTDPKYYRWTQWLFLKFLEHGLAYKSKQLINWCPKDKIGLANEEVVNGCCERCGTPVEKREKEQWMLAITKYAERLDKDLDDVDFPERVKIQQRNWIGKKEGAVIKFDDIEIFTTRPETIFGATFIAIAGATDKFTGRTVTNPATKEQIPVWEAEYVMSEVGTGALMGVPAHDERDFEFAKKHDLPVREVIMPVLPDVSNPHVPGKEIVFRRATINVVFDPKKNLYLTLKWKQQPWTTYVTGGVEEGEDPIESAKREIAEETGYTNIKFVRKLGSDARAEFYAAHKGVNRVAHNSMYLWELLSDEKKEISAEESAIHEIVWVRASELSKLTLKIQHSEKDLILEALHNENFVYTGSGILVSSGKFDGLDSDKARDEIIKFTGGEKKTTFKLRDWIFSRQRYWGEPIPVIHCEKCGVVPVPEKDLPVVLPEVLKYEPTDNGESPLANISDWVNVKCPKCGGDAKRETDTMPNWAGSSWYFLRYCDPFNDEEFASKDKLKHWMQVDWYNGGMEHTTLHLLYSRFWNKFFFDIGLVPTSEPYKKRTSHGLVLAEGGVKMSKSLGNVINPDIAVGQFGADTLRLYEMFMGPFEQAIAWSEDSLVGPRRFIEKIWKLIAKHQNSKVTDEFSLHQTIKKITEDIEDMKFNTAISTLMIYVNGLEKRNDISKEELETLLKLLAPFAPHVTEELWEILGNTTSIHTETWPKFDASKLHKSEAAITVQINGKHRATLTASADLTSEELEKLAKDMPEIQKWIGDNKIKKVIVVPQKVVNIVI